MDSGAPVDVGVGDLRANLNQSQPLDPADEALLAKVADQIVRRGLSVPAVFLLESSKPMSYVGSQGLVFLEPFVRAFLSLDSYNRFVRLIEDRDNYERLIEVIEARDAASEATKRAAKAEKHASSPEQSRSPGRAAGRWRRWFGRDGGR